MGRGVIAVLGLGLCACAASVPTVSYYKAHRQELDKRLDSCIARGETSQDCANAKQAYSELNGLPAQDSRPIIP